MKVKDFLNVFQGFTTIWIVDRHNDITIAHGDVNTLCDGIQLSDNELNYTVNSIKIDPLGDIVINCIID